jgi:hypothetical protein
VPSLCDLTPRKLINCWQKCWVSEWNEEGDDDDENCVSNFSRKWKLWRMKLFNFSTNFFSLISPFKMETIFWWGCRFEEWIANLTKAWWKKAMHNMSGESSHQIAIYQFISSGHNCNLSTQFIAVLFSVVIAI